MNENNIPDDTAWLKVTIRIFTTMNNFFQRINCQDRWIFNFFLRDAYGIINGPRPCGARANNEQVKCINLARSHMTVDCVLYIKKKTKIVFSIKKITLFMF